MSASLLRTAQFYSCLSFAVPLVIARTTILAQTVFGPFIAPVCDAGAAHSRTFASADGQCVTFDVGNDRWCNWMKLVRTADHGQHNLRVFIREQKILFVAVKVILPGEELTLALSKRDRKEIIDNHVNYVAVSVDCAMSGAAVNQDTSMVKCECEDGRVEDVAQQMAEAALILTTCRFSFDGDKLTLAHDQTDVLPPHTLPLPARWEEQSHASLIVQRKGSPEFPFPSNFSSAALDTLPEKAADARKLKIEEKEAASEQFYVSTRVHSLRRRNVVRAGITRYDDDFSDDNDDDFSLSGVSDSSTTDSECSSEAEGDLQGGTKKKRGRKARVVGTRVKILPKKTETVMRKDTAESVLAAKGCNSEEPNEPSLVRTKEGTKYHSEKMRRLNLVAKINPFQFSSRKERRAAWTAAWQAYQDDAEVGHRPRKSQKPTFSWKYFRQFVKMQLDNFPQALDRYNEDTASESRRQYIQVMRVIAQQAGKDYADGANGLNVAVNSHFKSRTLENYRPNKWFPSFVYRFVCRECLLHFKDENVLKLHSIQHSGTPSETTDLLDCPACQKSFKKLPSLLCHIIQHGESSTDHPFYPDC
ncbi:uncharacterized protein LOC129585552 [Paramacrobiotus metropolitanus]|uniref:uncharacterized protein LOC129585552 n=1 Tax=Paramacrobiotus metropolitanus TaxID=2943436 RepID=UPI002445A3F0|nr:uncharacterized protein LOC129585552 [Paramacrobiotus metropolitanus]